MNLMEILQALDDGPKMAPLSRSNIKAALRDGVKCGHPVTFKVCTEDEEIFNLLVTDRHFKYGYMSYPKLTVEVDEEVLTGYVRFYHNTESFCFDEFRYVAEEATIEEALDEIKSLLRRQPERFVDPKIIKEVVES